MKYLVLYGPTSVQRIIDFIKTVYAFKNAIPVIIKPIGAAAQIGVPEAYRYSYKIGKPMIILSELNDLCDVLKVGKSYYISPRGEKKHVKELAEKDNIAVIVPGGENEPSKKELEKIEVIALDEIPSDLPPVSFIALLLYLLKNIH